MKKRGKCNCDKLGPSKTGHRINCPAWLPTDAHPPKKSDEYLDVKLGIKPEEMIHYKSGAKRVEKGIPPTHLVCPQGDIRVALICAEGVERHAMIVDEAEFTTGDKGLPKFNLIKHIQNHWNKWRAGDRSEDHLAKIKWGLQKLMHKESQDPKLVADETQPWITACTHAKDMVSDEFRSELE